MNSLVVLSLDLFGAPLSTSSYLLWYLSYTCIFALFYIFSSPFTGNRELRKSWSGYVYVSTILYIWLGMAVAFHLPILQYDVRVPVSLFSPLFLASILTLFLAEGSIKVLNRWFVFHVGFKTHSLEVIQNAFVVSLGCCLVYSQCGSVSNEGLQEASIVSGVMSAITPAKKTDSIDQMCIYLFSGHVNSRYAHLPMVLVLWCTAVSALVVNYVLERMSGFRGMFSDDTSVMPLSPSPPAVGTTTNDSTSSTIIPPPASPRHTLSGNLAETSQCSNPPMQEDDEIAEDKEKKHRDLAIASSITAQPTVTAIQVAGLPVLQEELLSTGSTPIVSASSISNSFLNLSTILSNSYKMQLKKIRPILFRDMMDPPMLEMVPWYALLTTFTGVDLLIHLKLFVGRFDMRTLQAVTPNSFHYTPPLYPGHALSGGGFTSSNSLTALGGHHGGTLNGHDSSTEDPFTSTDNSPIIQPRRLHRPLPPHAGPTAYQLQHHVHQHHMDAPLVYDHCAEDADLWFDWIADTGDGFNSSYQIARTLAKPTLNVSVRRKGGRKPGALRLPRAKLLMIGGDLAYPSPCAEVYESRFFRPFQCAMPPPLNYDPAALSMHKPPIPGGVSGLKDWKGPTCFAIPGNHDWFDGLQTYLRYVCCRDWLGGWLMPQERSFFALQFPKGWWLFALDNALSNDIDAMQFKYFASIIERMEEDDRVILCEHEPGWIIDTHDQTTSGENTNYLIKLLKGKVALRMAGDIHNYTRHMPSPLIPGIKNSIQKQVSTAFEASAASSLFKGVIDTIFFRNVAIEDDDDDPVESVVDATLNHTAEKVRLLEEEQEQEAKKQAASGGTIGENQQAQVSYTSMLYSRFTSYGGDGEGIYLEDILDTLNPSMPLLRTQSMPVIPASAQTPAAKSTARTQAHLGGLQEGDEEDEEDETADTGRGGLESFSLSSARRQVPATDLKPRRAGGNVDVLMTRSASPHQPTTTTTKRRVKGIMKKQLVVPTGGAGGPNLPSPLPFAMTVPTGLAERTHILKQLHTASEDVADAQAALHHHAHQGEPLVDWSGVVEGATKPSSRPKKTRSTKVLSPLMQTIHAWSVDEVCDWLSSIGVHDGATHQAFSEHEVDGKLLLELDATDLLELGIQSGLKRKKLLLQLKDLRAKIAEQQELEKESSDEESSGSETEQLTQDILSGSTISLTGHQRTPSHSMRSQGGQLSGDEDSELVRNIGRDSVSLTGSLHSTTPSISLSSTTPIPPTLFTSSIHLPPAMSSSQPKAASGPELTAPHSSDVIDPSYAFTRRNVDVLSIAPEQELSLKNALAAKGISNETHTAVMENVLGPAGGKPTVSESPASVVTPESGASNKSAASTSTSSAASKHKKKTKKGKSSPAEISSSGSSSLDLHGHDGDTEEGLKSSETSPGVKILHSKLNPRSGELLGVNTATPALNTPKQGESLFGAAAVGANAAQSPRALSHSPALHPPRTPNRSPTLRPISSPSLGPLRKASPHLGSTGSTAMYNNTESVPIPTDPKENINISFPEGSEAPEVLQEALAGGSISTSSNTTEFGFGSSTIQEHVRPPPVLIVSGGGGAFMHPTHVPDPEPILFRGNRYVRASSYPPVAVSRAYALLNLFGFRKQNWRFDMFGGVIYFLLAFSCSPVCNLDHIILSPTWYDAVWQYIVAVAQQWLLVFTKGYVSLGTVVLLWFCLMSFGEIPWPWYKRFLVGTLHTLAHQVSAISALVLMETAIELGVHRKILGQGELLYLIFVRNFPAVVQFVDQCDERSYGIFGYMASWLSHLFDVPDNIAHYKQYMCHSYDTITRRQLLTFHFNCSLYLWVLMTPLVSFMFGAYLYIGSAFLNAHYTEAFSSLRIEGYKNLVRFHINRNGDLEVYTLGIDRVPKQWIKDPAWSGNTEPGTKPSYEWSHPSILKPEKGQPDRIKLIDYLLINRNPRNKSSFVRNSAAIAEAGGAHPPVTPAATSSRGPSISELVAPTSPPTSLNQRHLQFHTSTPAAASPTSASASSTLGGPGVGGRRVMSKSSASLHQLDPPPLLTATGLAS